MAFTDFKRAMRSKLRNLVKVIRAISCANKNRRREHTSPFWAGWKARGGVNEGRSNAADAHLSAGTAQGQIDTAIYFFQYNDELIICSYVQ